MRYYTNGAGGRFNHHALLTDKDILNIVDVATAPDLYCSVQSYNSEGIEVESQLVFDIDNESILDAYTIAKEIADNVQDTYDTDPSIWFSGSKGFHVITGLTGVDTKANIAMKGVAHRIADKIDDSMYKSRSMFRLPNSLNSKSGLRKIQVKYNESLKSILERARSKQPYALTVLDYNNSLFLEHFDESVVKAHTLVVHSTPSSIEGDWEDALPPCIDHLLTTGVPSGYRWEFCFWLVRHWRLCGVSVDEAVHLGSQHGVFSAAGDGHGYTEGMIRHYYDGMIRSIGCLSGPVGELMHKHCVDSCVHSDGWGERITANFIRGFT